MRTDIDDAVKRMGFKLGSGREIRQLPTILFDDEQVEHLVGGTYEGGTGLLALTNRRLIFLVATMMSHKVEDFPIDKISSVQWKQTFKGGQLKIYVSGNTAEITKIVGNAGVAIADGLRAKISGGTTTTQTLPPPPPPAPPVAGDTSSDLIGKLRELGELHQAGVLDAAEFATAKAKLLG